MNFVVNLQVCRVCMRMDKGLSLHENADIKNKFNFTTRLEIDCADNIPPLLCWKCVERLNAANDFIKSAHKSDKKFQEFISKISQNFSQISNDFFQSVGSDSSDSEGSHRKSKQLKSSLSPVRSLNKTVTFKLDTATVQDVGDANSAKVSAETGFNSKNDNGTHLKEVDSYLIIQNVGDCGLLPQTNDPFEECFVLEDTLETVDSMAALADQKVSEAEKRCENFENNLSADKVLGNANITQKTQDNNDKKLPADCPNIKTRESPRSISKDRLTSADSQEGNLLNSHEPKLNNKPLKFCAIQSSGSSYDNIPDRAESNLLGTQSASQCSITKKVVVNKLKSFCRSSMSLKSYICRICNKDFATKTNLNRHMATHDNPRPHQCNICGRFFSQSGSLKTHLLTHTGQKPHVCEYCNRGFSQAKSLVFHMRRHTGEKPFSCVSCGQCFRQKDGLRVHILKHHTMQLEGSLHKCVLCQIYFDGKEEFDNHMKLHLNNHPNSEQEQEDDSSLSVSDNEKLKPSEQAELIKSNAFILNPDTSTGAEPNRAKTYQCRHCFKTFAIEKSLIRHLNSHTSCQSPASSTALKQAAKPVPGSPTLSGPTSKTKIVYQCPKCDLIFKRAADLVMHRRNYHKNETRADEHNCYMCELDFDSTQELRNHLLQHHNIIE